MGRHTLTLLFCSALLIFCCVGAAAVEPTASQHAVKLQRCSGSGYVDGHDHSWKLQDSQLTGQHAAEAALPAAVGAVAPQQSGNPQAALQTTSGSRQLQLGTHSRRQLLQAEAGTQAVPAASSPAVQQWLQDSKQYATRFDKGSCFEDYPGFIAKDITGMQPLLGCSMVYVCIHVQHG
jgi:hypothetical protein